MRLLLLLLLLVVMVLLLLLLLVKSGHLDGRRRSHPAEPLLVVVEEASRATSADFPARIERRHCRDSGARHVSILVHVR